jgi:seryl-tRNA synthetase
MLDLNYVRENLEQVRAALAGRGAAPSALDDFAEADAERRRIIGESDRLNADRNAASREIGGLIKDGKREEADARRQQVNELKERIAELDRGRDQAEARMRELLATLPNIPHESVPIGTDESANVEIRRWARSRNSTLNRRTMSIWGRHSVFSTSSAQQRLPGPGSRFSMAPARG